MDDLSAPQPVSPEVLGEAWRPPPPTLPQPETPQRWGLHLALLAATFVTAALAGSWFWEGTFTGSFANPENYAPARIAAGLPYAFLLLTILMAHEMGHYLACRRYGVPATLPFFLPGIPLFIGTFGAVIRIRGIVPSRRALFDIAAAGPVAGFVVAFPVLVAGVLRAAEVPATADLHGMQLGSPLISLVFERAFHGANEIQVNGVFGAAWVGLLVTSMNLFPVGQLDGGHAVFAISPRAHRVLSWATIAAVAVLDAGQTLVDRAVSAYTLWLGILLFLRSRHPRLAGEGESLGPARIVIAVLLLAMFLLCFIPVPLSLT